MDAREALVRAPIFASLKPSLLDTLARSAKLRQFERGELLVKEGDAATTFFVLCSGNAEVVKGQEPEGRTVIGSLTPGDFTLEPMLYSSYSSMGPLVEFVCCCQT